MKQLLPLFLFLVPCLVLAQYPSNGNQKITLGEQTTADGLIYRGVASTDTVRKPSIDTMAYMVLDTTTNIIWHYKKATSNSWLRLNLLPSDTASMLTPYIERGDTASMLTPYWMSGRFSGVLPLLNGGTGSATKNFVDLTTAQTIAGVKTFNANVINQKSLSAIGSNYYQFKDNANNDIGYFGYGGSATNRMSLYNQKSGDILFSTSNSFTNKVLLRLDTTFKVTIGDDVAPTEVLHVVGNARITAMNGIGDIGADANGVLQAATSDMNLKNTIENSPFGLNEILLLNPITFLYNDTDRKIDSDVKEVGFIAQDVFDIIPNAVSSTGTGDLQLDYRAITATLTKAIQEQQALIKALEQRIINLENK
jgi:hypothetical protein